MRHERQRVAARPGQRNGDTAVSSSGVAMSASARSARSFLAPVGASQGLARLHRDESRGKRPKPPLPDFAAALRSSATRRRRRNSLTFLSLANRVARMSRERSRPARPPA